MKEININRTVKETIKVQFPLFMTTTKGQAVMVGEMPGDQFSTLLVSSFPHSFSISKIYSIKSENLDPDYFDTNKWQKITEEEFFHFIANVQARIQLAVDQLTLRPEYQLNTSSL